MDSDEEPMPYAMAAALARSVVRRYSEGERECLSGLFRDLEEMLGSAGTTPEDRNLLVVGFIEDLQNVIGWAGLDAKPFYALLGPISRSEWDDLVRMWDELAKKQASGELPASGSMPDVKDPQLREILQQIFRPPKQ
jgi:hypothetical protein